MRLTYEKNIKKKGAHFLHPYNFSIIKTDVFLIYELSLLVLIFFIACFTTSFGIWTSMARIFSMFPNTKIKKDAYKNNH